MKRNLLILLAVIFCCQIQAKRPGDPAVPVSPANQWTNQMQQSGTYMPKPKYNTSKGTMATGRRIISVPIPKTIVPKHAVETKIDDSTGMMTARWNDGSAYQGQTYYGEIKGVGTMVYPDGSKYCGSWERDLPNGNGTFQTPEGITFTVNFENGVPHGKGVIQDLDGRKYSARWVRGVLKEKSIKPLEEK